MCRYVAIQSLPQHLKTSQSLHASELCRLPTVIHDGPCLPETVTWVRRAMNLWRVSICQQFLCEPVKHCMLHGRPMTCGCDASEHRQSLELKGLPRVATFTNALAVETKPASDAIRRHHQVRITLHAATAWSKQLARRLHCSHSRASKRTTPKDLKKREVNSCPVLFSSKNPAKCRSSARRDVGPRVPGP